MNASNTAPQSIGLALILAIGLGAPALALAGPGSEYWHESKKPTLTTPASESKPLCTLDATCPDSKLVTISEARPTWSNGRGPLQRVDVGTKRVCYTCAGNTTMLQSTTSNGRPPYQLVQVAAKHDCTVVKVASKE
jgi:hypothetical protein